MGKIFPLLVIFSALVNIVNPMWNIAFSRIVREDLNNSIEVGVINVVEESIGKTNRQLEQDISEHPLLEVKDILEAEIKKGVGDNPEFKLELVKPELENNIYVYISIPSLDELVKIKLSYSKNRLEIEGEEKLGIIPLPVSPPEWVKIKPANEEEIEELYSIFSTRDLAPVHYYGLGSLSETLIAIDTRTNQIIGGTQFMAYDRAPEAFISSHTAVNEAYESLGIGSALFSKFIDIMRDNGYITIRFEAMPDAIEFSLHLGAEIIQEITYEGEIVTYKLRYEIQPN